MGGSDTEDELPPEGTQEELEARQAREIDELEEERRQKAEAKNAAKGKKATAAAEAAERAVEQQLYDLRLKHKRELERFAKHASGEGVGDGGAAAGAAAEAAPAAPEPAAGVEVEDEAGRIRRKKEKAQRKRQGKAAREAELEAERERELREAGPSKRDLELQSLAASLAALRPPREVLEVSADGHCLYRSVADQLKRVCPGLLEGPPHEAHEEVRRVCAASLRRRADSYSPFAEFKDGEDFDGYCNRVENTSDWGGELELRALADELGVQIEVHRAEEPPLLLGEAGDRHVLHVAFHRYYLVMGEHYNSVVPAGGK